MMSDCQAAIATLQGLQANAPALMIFLSSAAIALLWQWHDDYRRDRICAHCGNCQTQIHGTPDVPPPSSGVPK